jgi:uncharacterized membrane protein
MKTHPLYLGLLFIIILGMSACGDKFELSQGTINSSIGDVTYTNDIAPIMEQYCVGCHASTKAGGARGGAPVSINLDTYADTMSHADKSNREIQSGGMPPSGTVSAEEKAIFQAWIDQNMPQ